jgi:lysyl-tRNA synthetase class 2
MITPQFLIHHPIDLSPLARKNDNDPMITDRFQLVVNGWEAVNAYSELVDPIDQRDILVKQAVSREGGDEEAMIMEEDFVLCMEYGMPPISGWGMGIDRFVALLTNQENVRDVVLFPLMKPIDYDKKDHKTDDKNDIKNSNKNENIDNRDRDNKIYEPLSIDDLGISNEKLESIFVEKITKESLIAHSIASAQIMKKIANKFGLNENSFYYIGLLHDLDLNETENDMANHGKLSEKWLNEIGMNELATKAIAAHNFDKNGTKCSNFIDYALISSEAISGLISATARIYPDKKVASVKPASVIKRMKEKAFAANVNRDSIMLCEKIGLSLEEFATLAVDAMKEVADKIGL